MTNEYFAVQAHLTTLSPLIARSSGVISCIVLHHCLSRSQPFSEERPAATTLEWNITDFRTALTWFHTGGYDQKASAAATAVQSRVDSYEQLDLYFGWSGIENLTLYTKVENLFDEEPPHDASFPGIRAPYDFTQYDLRKRSFLVGLNYRL